MLVSEFLDVVLVHINHLSGVRFHSSVSVPVVAPVVSVSVLLFRGSVEVLGSNGSACNVFVGVGCGAILGRVPKLKWNGLKLLWGKGKPTKIPSLREDGPGVQQRRVFLEGHTNVVRACTNDSSSLIRDHPFEVLEEGVRRNRKGRTCKWASLNNSSKYDEEEVVITV